jgi:hypothetical protein
VNKEIIKKNKEKDDLLPVGASEAVKATRPIHNYNQMLKSFNQSAVKTSKISPKDKALRR